MFSKLRTATLPLLYLSILAGLPPLGLVERGLAQKGRTQQPGTRASSQLIEAPGVLRDIDPDLALVIAETPAIDNHAHPMLSPPADAADREFDALPVDNMEPQTDPVAWRADWPKLSEAWQVLYGFRGVPPLDAAGQGQLDAARSKVKAREGEGYSAWVLSQAGIGTMLANRVAMGTRCRTAAFSLGALCGCAAFSSR